MGPLTLSPALWLAVNGLACARLARLIGQDLILERPREWFHVEHVALWDFLTCPWCTSVWVAAGIVALTVLGASWWVYPAVGLALSEIAGLASAVAH
jgi:hypothetical protein